MKKGNKQKKTKKAVSGQREKLVTAMRAQESGTIPDEFNKRRADLPLDVGFVAQVPFIVA